MTSRIKRSRLGAAGTSTVVAAAMIAAACSGDPGGEGPERTGGDGDAGRPGQQADAGPGDAGSPGQPDDAGTPDRSPPTTIASPDAAKVRQTAVTVTLSTDEPATTYVTLDGSEPTTTSARYTGPIVVDRTRTLRFFSVDAAGNAEAPQSLRYRIDTVRRLLLDVAAN